MKESALVDLLTDEQLLKCVAILNKGGRATELKAYLAPFRTELEAKGVVPEYLAYWLEYKREDLLQRKQKGKP